MANTHSLDLEAGSSQYAHVADHATLSPTQSMTIEAYVNFESLPASGQEMFIASKARFDTNQVSWTFSLFNDSGTLKLRHGTSTDGSNFEGENVNWTPSTSTWYHVAAAFDHTVPEVRFYVDGALQGAAQAKAHSSIFDSSTAFQVGTINHGGTPSQFMDGLIDEVKYWSVARTALQIATHYQNDVTGQTGLLGYWQLNNDLTDSSGGGFTLTAVGSPVFSATVPFSDYAEAGAVNSMLWFM